MVACLKLGAIHCVVDSRGPWLRLEKMLRTCRPRLICFARGAFSAQPGLLERDDMGVMVDLESLEQMAETRSVYGVDAASVTGDSPAYVMFTSGSTGSPKAAVIAHASVLNFVRWARTELRISSEDVATGINPLYFDNAVFDFYANVFSGACLAPIETGPGVDPAAIVAAAEAAGCTQWFSVPSLLSYLDECGALQPDSLPALKKIVFGGEGFAKLKLQRLIAKYGDRARLFNVYGPTECTCMCSCHEVTAADFNDLIGFPSLGKIAANFDFLILNDENREVACGDAGELCLLGPNVGRGYYRDAEQTARSFTRNPLNENFDERMYRTGDLVRVDPATGLLHYVGRRDNQVKHLGYRVELEEVEAVLCALHYVKEAVAWSTVRSGTPAIVAAVATNRPTALDKLRADLRLRLPPYMIPDKLVFCAALPRNANGKVDRAAARLAQEGPDAGT
jgi:D-alanine--poly(phosphoribitol) ligase subunit 1